MSGTCDRRATPPGGMHRRPNANELLRHDTSATYRQHAKRCGLSANSPSGARRNALTTADARAPERAPVRGHPRLAQYHSTGEVTRRSVGSTLAALCVVTMLFAACRSSPPAQPPPKDVVVWKPIASWSGRGDKQTETFTGDTGGFRVHWETTNESHAGGGRLRVVFRSGDSGREIIEAIDARGTGRGIEDVAAERPRWYYITVESANVDWTIAIDERIDAQTTIR